MKNKEHNKYRYIKLGQGGEFAHDCINQNKIMLGFLSGEDEMFDACTTKNWEEVEKILFKMRTNQISGKKPKTVKNDLRQVKEFFDPPENRIWITFHNRFLYWGKMSNNPPVKFRTNLTQYSMDSEGWKCNDINNKPIKMDDLAGHLTMVSQYRGTICDIKNENYLDRRIHGKKSVEYVKGKESLDSLHEAIIKMMCALDPRDFEVLVETVFVNCGWKRLGRAGETEEAIDLLLSRLSANGTEEIVAVQVKSNTKQEEYQNYVEKLVGYDKSFFVYHTGKVHQIENCSVRLINANELAPMVVKAGVVDWLLNRVK
jgi:hypothetical protein